MDPTGVSILLNTLPETILPAIFSGLPSEDLKNWRLVNRYWYYNCTIVEVTKREKFVFSYGLHGSDPVCLAKYILACERTRPTIEFRGFSLKSLPLEIWKHFGRMLTSLHVHDCHMDRNTVSEIILSCPNLVRLHLQVHSTYDNRLFSSTTLNDLIARNVERSRLRSFKLFTGYFRVENTEFSKIFRIFPNIEILGRDFVLFDDEPWNSVIDFLSGLPQSVTRIELRIMMILKRERRNSKIGLCKRMMSKILNLFPNIKAVRFESNSRIAFTEPELAEFLRAIQHLESLNLHFREFTLARCDPSFRYPSVEYKFLKDLRLIIPTHGQVGDSHRIGFEILKRCSRSLVYLDLPGQIAMADDVMDSILTDHTELKTLSVPSMRCHADCATGLYPTPLDQFADLKFLSFNFCQTSCAEEILSKLPGSQLKIFRSKCATVEDVIGLLNILPVVAPQLETLCLEAADSCLFIEDFITSLKGQKKLRYLIVEKQWTEVPDSAIGDLFCECSSLMYAIYPSMKIVYHRSEKSFLKKTWYAENIYDSLGAYFPGQYPGL